MKSQTERKAKKRSDGAVSTAQEKGVASTPAMELSGKDYERELKKLHVELVKLQEWAKATGAKICICFEGRDTAGKGGAIKAITERVNPRVFRVVALPARPSARRPRCISSAISSTSRPPARSSCSTAAGTIAPASNVCMGYCSKGQAKVSSRRILLERAIIEAGILLFKYCLEVRPEEEKRLRNASAVLSALEAFTDRPGSPRAIGGLFQGTRRDAQGHRHRYAPWYAGRFDDKKRARLNVHLAICSHPFKKRPLPKVKLPPLSRKPKRERFGALKPIRAFRAALGRRATNADARSRMRRRSWLDLDAGARSLLRYEAPWLKNDVVAGLVLTTMLVPVGIAYAVASGVPGSTGSTPRSSRCSPTRCSAPAASSCSARIRRSPP